MDLYDEEQLTRDYFDFLRFRSISADPEYGGEMRACADWVAKYLEESGLQVEQWETPGYPVVAGKWMGAEGKPTLLLYGHYDVQPVDPLDEWESDPFEPTVRGRDVFARGAQDNKGQILYAMAAIRALMKRDGKLPINVKVCIEGEEESKSVGFSKVLEERKEQLQADYLVAPDFDIPAADRPSIVLGLRGLVALTVDLRGSKHDLHSGMAGGIVYNPNHALVEMLAALRNEEGQVVVPGFYDDVEMLSDEERDLLTLDLGDEQLYREEFEAEANGGEADLPPGESARARPTLEINGISGGYSGPGFKTVIPAQAQAKISCRLVPHQDHAKIRDAIVKFLEERCPKGMEMTVTDHGGAGAMRASVKGPLVDALAKAYEEVFGKECVRTLSGGSVPITQQLARVAGAEAVFMGTGLMSDAIHAPNEHFNLDRQRLGFQVFARFLELL
jgi:acetylornithine deacetylase/succinyl-diaminopimelate desuccinylase-like protein